MSECLRCPFTTPQICLFSSAPTCLARVLRVNKCLPQLPVMKWIRLLKVAYIFFYCDFPALSSMIRQICCSSFLSNEKGGMQALYFISKLIVASTLSVFVVGFVLWFSHWTVRGSGVHAIAASTKWVLVLLGDHDHLEWPSALWFPSAFSSVWDSPYSNSLYKSECLFFDLSCMSSIIVPVLVSMPTAPFTSSWGICWEMFRFSSWNEGFSNISLHLFIIWLE